MATKLPPLPVGVAPGSGYWNDWYEKLRKIINDLIGGVGHNTLAGLQGGAAGEYFHLTSAEHLSLTTNLQTTIENYAMPTYARQFDEDSATVNYFGEADEGSATSAAAWRIQKIVFTGADMAITWADGNSSFDNIWDNRTSLTYS